MVTKEQAVMDRKDIVGMNSQDKIDIKTRNKDNHKERQYQLVNYLRDYQHIDYFYMVFHQKLLIVILKRKLRIK